MAGADMGIGGGFAAGGAADALQQLFAQRLQVAQMLERQRQQQIDNALRERQFQSNEELKRAQLDSLTEDRKARAHTAAATEQDRQVGLANTLGDQIPGGTFIPPTDPAVGMLRTGGRGSLLMPQQERPQVDVGPLLPGDTGAARAQGFIKAPSFKQASDAAAKAEQATKDAAAQADREARNAETERYHTWMLNKPTSSPTVVVQTTDDQGNPVTKIVPKVAGSEFKGRTNATTDNRLVSAKAVVQTGDDMIKSLSDPKIAAMLGPYLGRYNSVADFVGNPPPEFAKLAGQIESYALANMGVHGMRANNGAEAIKATLGAGRHTPQTIIAIIQGLNGFANHLLDNEGRNGSTPAAGTKPSAADLIKKYGGK